MESFFHSLKNGRLPQKEFKNVEEAREAIFAYIEGWYNTKRLHSTLEYVGYVGWIAYCKAYKTLPIGGEGKIDSSYRLSHRIVTNPFHGASHLPSSIQHDLTACL